jgi:tetratricopeptide (TPR) repeat protein
MRYPFGLVLALLLSACSGSAPLPPRAAALNQGGVEALENGDLDAASARFGLALEYHPRFVEALANQGLVELQRGNFSRARQLLERAVRVNPDIAQPHHGLGVLAEREGSPASAAEHYREALAVDPGFVPSRFNLARLLFESRELHHAEEQFRRLTAAAPEDPRGYAGHAEALLGLGRVEEAASAVHRGLERAATDPSLSILRARLKLLAGDAHGAVDLLAPLARERSDVGARALAFLAVAELARNEPRRAIAAAARSLAVEPRDEVAAYAMANALEALGDPRAAKYRRQSETVPAR